VTGLLGLVKARSSYRRSKTVSLLTPPTNSCDQGRKGPRFLFPAAEPGEVPPNQCCLSRFASSSRWKGVALKPIQAREMSACERLNAVTLSFLSPTTTISHHHRHCRNGQTTLVSFTAPRPCALVLGASGPRRLNRPTQLWMSRRTYLVVPELLHRTTLIYA
jgi:hypothetical protein